MDDDGIGRDVLVGIGTAVDVVGDDLEQPWARIGCYGAQTYPAFDCLVISLLLSLFL